MSCMDTPKQSLSLQMKSKKNEYFQKKSLGNGEGKLKRKMKNTPKREPSTLEAAEMPSADMHLLIIKQIW